MNLGQRVFAQLMEFIPTDDFQLCVDRYQGNRYVEDFSCWDQFLCLAFAQLTGRTRLRDIEICRRAQRSKLYHRGFPRSSFSRHARRRQRGSRLADLSPLRPSAHRQGARALPQCLLGSGLVRDRLCFRLHHHRWVSVAVSLGAVSAPQKRGQAAYLVGRAGQHSDQCLCDRRAGPRRQPARSTPPPGRSLLLDGSRLCGLRPSLGLHPSLCLLYHARQKESALLPSHLAPRRSLHRGTVRPNHSPDRHPDAAALSPCAAPHRLRRRPEGVPADLPDQPFFPSPAHPRPTVSGALAGRMVLPLDPAAPVHQGFLRHLRQRREDPRVGRPLDLRAGGDPHQATRTGPESVLNSANSQCHDLRKTPDFTGVFQCCP